MPWSIYSNLFFLILLFHSDDPNQPLNQQETQYQTCLNIEEDFELQKTINKQLCNTMQILMLKFISGGGGCLEHTFNCSLLFECILTYNEMSKMCLHRFHIVSIQGWCHSFDVYPCRPTSKHCLLSLH